jgi:hypothetical protein
LGLGFHALGLLPLNTSAITNISMSTAAQQQFPCQIDKAIKAHVIGTHSGELVGTQFLTTKIYY